MKLKPQPKAPRPARRGAHAARRGGARPHGRQAKRPGVPLRRRVAGRLPSLRRVVAALAAAATAAALAWLLQGPWLRVADVTWAGGRYTTGDELAHALDGQRGRSVLAVDTQALRERLVALPSVSEASVSASLTGEVTASIVEPEVAFVWQTRSARFLGAADGVIFARLPLEAELPEPLAGAARIDDRRFVARLISVGDRIPGGLLDAALRIHRIDPAALGSEATGLTVRLDDEFGFRLVSSDPGWEAALGVYGLDPNETSAEAAARLERQVTAVRTLFASQSEDGIGWVDVRNPGKVYFRAKG